MALLSLSFAEREACLFVYLSDEYFPFDVSDSRPAYLFIPPHLSSTTSR
jgi:hypothetical protein